MKPRHLLRFLTASVLALGAIAAGAQTASGGEVKRIIQDGSDGERTFYTVSCRNGDRATIYVKHASEETCSVARNGKPQCQKEGLLRDAAERACKAPGRG